MLQYVTDLMEDAQEFGWASAKGTDAFLLCRMEEGKLSWHATDKIESLRKAHTQKIISNNVTNKKEGADTQCVLCKYYQNGKCPQKVNILPVVIV